MTNLGPYMAEGALRPSTQLLKYLRDANELLRKNKDARKFVDKLLKQRKVDSREYSWLLDRALGIMQESVHVDVPRDVAMEIGRKLGVNFEEVDFDEFRKGIGVEMEHSETVGDGFTMAALIALDHLEELPDYYTKLETIE